MWKSDLKINSNICNQVGHYFMNDKNKIGFKAVHHDSYFMVRNNKVNR